MGTSYWDYIRTEELLSLQGGIPRDERGLSNHEVLFIVVHQVFELWFKLVLRELTAVRDILRQENVPEGEIATAAWSLGRTVRILQVASAHWTVMESLSPRDFLDFREKLFPASGFQSAQLREIEILLGLEDDERLGMGKGERFLDALRETSGEPSPALRRVQARRQDRPTLKEALEAWLLRTPICGSRHVAPDDEAVVRGFLEEYLTRLERAAREAMEERIHPHLSPDEKEAIRKRHQAHVERARAWMLPGDPPRTRIRAAILFIESYRELPLLAWPRQVLDGLVEVEQALVVFRQRHARMVERMIGRRVGTGGSSGVEYLDETALAYRVFQDLWAARTYLLARAELPPVEAAPYFDFPVP